MALSPGEVPLPVEDTGPEEWHENLNVKVLCPDCLEDPPNLFEEHSSGDMVCGNCGMVLQQNIVDTRSEWRSFANDDQGNDDPSRVGAAHNPTLDVGQDLSSGIQYDNKSSYVRDLHRLQSKTTDDRGNKQLQDAFNNIQDLCNFKNWPRTISDTAKQLYKTTWDSRRFRSKSQEGIIAGCLFIACRQMEGGRTFKEVAKLTGLPKKEVGRIFKLLEKFFKEVKKTKKGATEIGNYKATNATKPQVLCGRFGDLLDLPTHIGMMAGDCTELLIASGLLAGRSPLSIAAVSLYAISNFMNHPKSAKQVGKACQVSDGTIKSAWKKIYDDRMKIIKPEWIDRGGTVSFLPKP